MIVLRNLLLPRACGVGLARRLITKESPIETIKHASKQLEYFKNVIENNIKDWNTVKSEILANEGSMNEKNLDAVLLRYMMKHKKIDAALSFAEHIKKSEKELNLGTINGLLLLYAELNEERHLEDAERTYILNTYRYLYDKYKVLDSTTCEALLHALCAIDEWEKASKVLDDIFLSSKPTHSAYSTLIGALFRVDKESEAMGMIAHSLENKRPLQCNAYEEWIKYIFRKYKDNETISQHVQDICKHISKQGETVSFETAHLLKDTFSNLGWNAQFTEIKDNQCRKCEETLDCLKLTDEEFELLQRTVKDRLIVGSDLFLKSSPEELQNFMAFVKKTAPYDIVIDGLNVAYSMGLNKDKIGYLTKVVDHFRQRDKKILLLGRKHMMRWPRINHLLRVTCSFFTDNLSQDDPYFITAAILSGPHTDVVSKDLLRGHRFMMQDQKLRGIFQRWQWQHQWKVFVGNHPTPSIQEPMSITPSAQNNRGTWHLPYVEEGTHTIQLREGAPDWRKWLCLHPPSNS